MSITLSIPPAVVQEARAYAIKNGTTMSRMIREYFTNLVAPRKAVRSDSPCRFLELAESAGVRLPEGCRITIFRTTTRRSIRPWSGAATPRYSTPTG